VGLFNIWGIPRRLLIQLEAGVQTTLPDLRIFEGSIVPINVLEFILSYKTIYLDSLVPT
jgi:hypothetical protein